MLVVGEVFSEPILLSATSMVGLTACEVYRKVPVILCTRVMPRFSSFGAVVASGEYWTLAPYAVASHLWGEYWGRLGVVCWKHYKALMTYLGIEMSMYFSV